MVGDPRRPSQDDGPGTSGESRRVLLGELLVDSKVITPEQLGEVLSSPREAGKKLGQVLLERGWITEAQLTQTLSLQLSVPWVSLYHIDFSRQLLNRVSREIAEKYCLIPIFIRHVKGQGETLYVAMDDPTNEVALQEVARASGLPTKPMIASASDIRSAIRVYYGEPSAPKIEVPATPTRADPPVTAREGKGAQRIEPPPATPAAPTVPDPPRSQPAVAARRSRPNMAALVTEEEAPATTRSNPPAAEAQPRPKRMPSRPDTEPEPRRRIPRMVNLTLLDGTTISLPAKKKNDSGPPEKLTARDFVSALRATAHGADASEILGDNVKWEPIVAALLSILLRKGLIADWEFVEELTKCGPSPP
jgi:type IV pilus assembly protein PilB